MGLTLTAISLNDAEKRANQAASVVVATLVQSTIDYLPAVFPHKKDQAEAVSHLQTLAKDDEFREKIEAAYISWFARTHVLVPPKRS